jgi:hypothetical protein
MKKNLLLSFIVLVLFAGKIHGQAWSGLGTGVGTASSSGDSVLAITVDAATGDMYAGGSFTLPANRVAKYTLATDTWTPLGAGLSGGSVKALAFYGGFLYAGGNFTGYLAKCNPAVGAWTVIPGVDAPVYALIVFGTDLFVGGAFTAPFPRAAKYNGTALSAAGNITNGQINAFAIHNAELYAGGTFTGRVAKWVSGFTWDQSAYAGLGGPVEAMASHGTSLYVSGYSIFSGSQHMAKWTTGGSGWASASSPAPTFPSLAYPKAMISFNPNSSGNGFLWVGGNFDNLSIGPTQYGRIPKFDGTTWSRGITTPSTTVNNNVYAFGAIGTGTKTIYAGGIFVYPFLRIMKSSGLVGIDEESLPAASINIFPNPAHNTVKVDIQTDLKNPKAEIYNMLGKKVFSKNLDSKFESLDIRGISAGIYFLKIVSEEENERSKIYVQKLIIE